MLTLLASFRHIDWRFFDRGLPFGQKFAELDYCVLHLGLNLGDLLQLPCANFPVRLCRLVSVDFDLLFNPGPAAPRHPRERRSVHQHADRVRQSGKRLHLDGLCGPQERHPTLHDQLARLLLHEHQLNLLLVGQ